MNNPCRASVLSEKMQGFWAGMRCPAATGWIGAARPVEAATGDRRHGEVGAATNDRSNVLQVAKFIFGEFRLLEDGTKGSGGNIPGVHR
ncbi:MAG: hypothetical protein KGQ87_02785 [Verrucomicrobia bacterium]|nr:hypothetical protein [Verrucomicrobiota bacterium]